MVSIVLESASWRCVDASPPVLFGLEGPATVRRTGQRRSITAVEGQAIRVESGALVLDDGEELRLRHTLPDRIDLSPLLRRRLRVTLRTEPLPAGPAEQLLTVADCSGRVWMIAHFGAVDGDAQVVGDTRLVAALSQRPGGPMVFGTPQLQCIVHAGGHVTVREGGRDMVMYFLARTSAGYAAYAIVDHTLWR